jgi:HD-GYP domain-containing protein (c-di-GMP phosphodiesterase class II)
VLRDIPVLARCAQGVLAQLEHYDGTGTPLGIRNEQIPLPARIIAVANAYDVMTHPRAYAREQSSIEALQEIEACAATQFDPAIVLDLLAHFGIEPRLEEWPLETGS